MSAALYVFSCGLCTYPCCETSGHKMDKNTKSACHSLTSSCLSRPQRHCSIQQIHLQPTQHKSLATSPHMICCRYCLLLARQQWHLFLLGRNHPCATFKHFRILILSIHVTSDSTSYTSTRAVNIAIKYLEYLVSPTLFSTCFIIAACGEIVSFFGVACVSTIHFYDIR